MWIWDKNKVVNVLMFQYKKKTPYWTFICLYLISPIFLHFFNDGFVCLNLQEVRKFCIFINWLILLPFILLFIYLYFIVVLIDYLKKDYVVSRRLHTKEAEICAIYRMGELPNKNEVDKGIYGFDVFITDEKGKKVKIHLYDAVESISEECFYFVYLKRSKIVIEMLPGKRNKVS